jgi:hypothetical protein
MHQKGGPPEYATNSMGRPSPRCAQSSSREPITLLESHGQNAHSKQLTYPTCQHCFHAMTVSLLVPSYKTMC